MASAATIQPEHIIADTLNTGHAGDAHGAAQPWHRQPGESSKGFAYFTTYLHLGPHRSLHAAAAKVGKSHQNLLKFAKRFSWTARVEAFDRHIEKEDSALWEEQHRAARRAQMQWELQRQVETRRLAELLHGLLLQFEGVRLVNAEQQDDGTVAHEVAKGAGTVAAAVALLAREFIRASRCSIDDLVAEQRHRWKADEKKEGPLAGEKVPGTFAVGDRMWDNSEPPPLPDSVREVIDGPGQSPDAPEQTLFDLSGMGNLYEPARLDAG